MEEEFIENDLSDWVKRYTKDLLIWAYNKTSDRELAADLVQETFLAAAESLSSFQGRSEPKTWLLGILKNKIASHYRQNMRQAKTVLFSPEDLNVFFKPSGHWKKNARPKLWQAEPIELTNIPAFNRILDVCIEDLPSMMNACIRLKFLDEKKGQIICQELGISDTNYWQLIRRAKLHLRSCLETNWFQSN